jgi:hypothetical protein
MNQELCWRSPTPVTRDFLNQAWFEFGASLRDVADAQSHGGRGRDRH